MEENSNYLLNYKHKIERMLLLHNKKFDDMLESKTKKQLFILNDEDVNDILSNEEYETGIYGFINYQIDLKIDKLLDRSYTFYNKASVIKKVLDIKNNNLTEEGNKNNYGFLQLYEKTENEIKNIKQYYLLKNGNINYLNNSDNKSIILKDLPDEYIITKIYKFINDKIMLLTVMTKKDYYIEDNDNIEYVKYFNIVKQMCGTNEKALKYLLDFDSIYRYRKIINKDNNNGNMDIDDVLDFNFSKYIDNIKINNKYESKEYENILLNNLNADIDDINNDINEKYNITELKDTFKILFEILFRMYIEISNNSLNEQVNVSGTRGISYCLSKKLVSYIPINMNGIYSQYTSKILIDRHWKRLLNYGDTNICIDSKEIINTCFSMLKTMTLRNILEFVEEMIELRKSY